MSASSGAAAPLNRAFSPLLLIALWTLRFYLAEITGYRKTADSRISTNILVFDAGDVLGKLLLALDVALTGDHDALGLGRTGTMHGLSAVANGGSAQAQVLNEAHNALTVLGLDALAAHKELIADLADGLAVAAHHRVGVEVHLRGHGDHQAARDVLSQTHDLIGEAGHVLLADVCQQQVDLIVAGLGLEALRGAGSGNFMDSRMMG